MKTIAVDMDEVIVDALQKSLNIFNERYGMKLTKNDLQGLKLQDLYPQLEKEIYEYTNDYSFFRNLELIDNCKETLIDLSQHYEIVIATAAMEVPNSLNAKYEWLKEHLQFLNDQHFIFCGDKRFIQADYLIDDNLYQLENFSNEGILFTAPHNINEKYNMRLNNWLEVKEYFMLELSFK